MTRLTLSSVSSLRRNIGGPCTVLKIHNGRVFAGSQEGILACWIVDSGEEVWKVAISGPLSDIDFSGGKVHVSGSSNIYCLDYNSGEIVWSRELEGPATMYSLTMQVSGLPHQYTRLVLVTIPSRQYGDLMILVSCSSAGPLPSAAGSLGQMVEDWS